MTDKDPVLNLFFWFSGLAVVAIVLVEVLVCFAVVAFFRRHPEETNVWKTLIAPILAALGLLLGEYLLMSRFGLLAGTVAEGVDPTTQSWGLNLLGYTLVFLPSWCSSSGPSSASPAAVARTPPRSPTSSGKAAWVRPHGC